MAVIFTTYFTTPSLAEWDNNPYGLDQLLGWGCSGGYTPNAKTGLAGPCNVIGFVQKFIAVAPSANGYTVRVQMGIFAGGQNNIPMFGGSLPGGSPSIAITAHADGHIELYESLTATTLSSAAGAFNITGIMQGIELLLDFSVTTQLSVNLQINDVSILSGTIVYTGGVTSPFTGNINFYTYNGTDGIKIIATAHYEIENTYNDISYLACTAVQLVDPVIGSFCDGPSGGGGGGTTTVTDMILDCDTKYVTITGTGFAVGATVELINPLGIILTYTVVGTPTSTQIVIDVSGSYVDFGADSEYCVSVINP